MQTWAHYLLPREFVIYTDNEALKYLRGQAALNPYYARWVEYIEAFGYVVKYKQGTDNVVVDALSRRYTFLTTLNARILGFSLLRDLYHDEIDFGEIFSTSMQPPSSSSARQYFVPDGFLF